MLNLGSIIPSDKMDPVPVAEGSRIRVHRLRGMEDLEGRVVRIPKDAQKDPSELVQMQLLKRTPLAEFLPSPEVVRLQVGDEVRALVASLEINSRMQQELPSAGGFRIHLGTQKDLEAKIGFLARVRAFVEACKATYWGSQILPDLVGKGNIVSEKEGVWLLDFNNISGKWKIGGEVEVPLDDQGLPIFDMGLRLMHSIEKTLLSNRGGNFSTESFNREFRRERVVQGQVFPEELKPILVSKEDLKKDPFYGALRFGARREEVKRILERYSREWFVN